MAFLAVNGPLNLVSIPRHLPKRSIKSARANSRSLIPLPNFSACLAKPQSAIIGWSHVTAQVGGRSVGCLQVSMWNASNFCCCDRYRENHATANPFPCPNPERNNPLHDDTGVAGNTLGNVLVSCLLACRYICDVIGRGKLTGQSSAASFPTGPVIADPFISPFGLTIYRNSVSQNPLFQLPHRSRNFPPSLSAKNPAGANPSSIGTNEIQHSPHQRCPRSTRRHHQFVSMACSV